MNTARKKIDTTATMLDAIVQMSEGNPGAMTVLMDVAKLPPTEALGILLTLDDMNMRGPQIWVAYKDHSGENFEQFAGYVQARDAEMIETVNTECFHPAQGQPELAVQSGGSWEHKP